MGRQLEFYMHPDDLAALELLLRDRWELSFFPVYCSSETPAPLETLALDTSGLRSCQNETMATLCRTEDTGRLALRSCNFGWRVDFHECPAIEFSRSCFDGQTLRPGRLWYVSDRQQDRFIKTANSIFRYVRKVYTRQGRYYAGPSAIKWQHETGGVFGDIFS